MATTDLFRSMIAYWKAFDLQKVQEELDRTASMLAVQCEETDISRQLLLQKSREFKRNSSEDIQKATAPLLKSFQSEIDGLLRRSKLAESAFLSVYRMLIPMPDMLPVLMAADELQSEVERLQRHSAVSSEPENNVARNQSCVWQKNTKDSDNFSEKMMDIDENDELQSCNPVPSEVNGNHLETKTKGMNGTKQPDEHRTTVLLAQTSAAADRVLDVHRIAHDIQRSETQPQDVSVDLGSLRSNDFRAEESGQEIKSPGNEGDCSSQGGLFGTRIVQSHSENIEREWNQCNTGASDHQSEATVDDLDQKNESVVVDGTPITEEKTIGGSEGMLADCCQMQKEHILEDGNAGDMYKNQLEEDASLLQGAVTTDHTAKCGLTELTRHTMVLADDDADPDSDVQKTMDQDLKVRGQTVDLGRDAHWTEDVLHGNNLESSRQTQEEEQDEDNLNNLSKMEELASEIGHEVVTSFQNNNLCQKSSLWLHDHDSLNTESVLLQPPLAHAHSPFVTPFSSDLSTCHGPVVTLEELKPSESADGLVPLDTMDVARRIREILSFHNLGQRLFARYVLGLSQGTVSELLSKPKPWEKLTEKGRESYRKMHMWAGDERNIQMLKSLGSPKSNVSSSSGGQADAVAEERIAQILSEAQAAMQLKHEPATVVAKFEESALSAPPKVFETCSRPAGSNEAERGHRKSKSSRKSSNHSSGSRSDLAKARKTHAESENLTREIVVRIYQEELEKLAQVAEANGNMVELLNYRQQLARLNQGSGIRRSGKPDTPQSVTEDKENHKEALGETARTPKKFDPDGAGRTVESKIDPDQPQDLSISGSSETCYQPRETSAALPTVKANASSETPAPGTPLPALLPTVGSSTSGLMSPLQRMQSIANSLMLQSPSSSSQAQQPSRAILPPISQEQFDLYANICTDELVKRVKDVLSQFSISQRLFGEYVLGLSQGSVSDLLARPKPWHLLTQKGREPFIRMQMFVDDPESVQKLVASQYRVPTEKLLHSNSSSHLDGSSLHGMANDISGEIADSCDFPATTSRSSTPFRSSAAGSLGDSNLPRPCALSSNIFSTITSSPPASESMTPTLDKSIVASGVSFPPVGVAMVPSVLSLFGATFLPSAQFGPLVNVDMRHLYGGGPAATPEVGTSSASPELDTQAITARVKEVLQLNNLGQKLFGEAVLELSQGSVSELLSKPKPWHMLSLKGREPFVKMQMWLNDPLGVQKLHAYQTHMAGRRRKSGCDGSTSEKPGNQKKPRLFFSEEQKEALKTAYLRDPYPNQLAIEQLAGELDIGVKTVINWFHNHRMRAKQHQSCNSPTSTTASSPSSTTLSRVKSEMTDDASDLSRTRWMVFAPEDNSTCLNTTGNCAMSASADERGERLLSAAAHSKRDTALVLPSPSTGKCNNVESKRRELNKRKRARPHRLYDGVPAGRECQASKECQAREEFQTSDDVAIDLSIGGRSNVFHSDHLAVPKLSQMDDHAEAFESHREDLTLQKKSWADIKEELPDNWSESHRVKNIEKLQQNLLLVPSDDWEF